MKKLFLVIAVACVAAMSAGAQTVGYVDTEKILSRISEYVNAQNELNTLAEKYKADIQKDVDAIDALYRSYQSQKSSLTTAQRESRENQIIAKEKAVKEKEQKYFGEDGILTKKSETLISPIQDVVEKAITAVAEANNCSVVLDLTVVTGVVYKNPRFDLTQAVINYLAK
ncbi:MAG: OmpH family outer membrane protein [Bacteroidales bacterium]|nr:OmpH family outer membrane protein [Bacteroidales bacterium]